jgi:hypothetical protein
MKVARVTVRATTQGLMTGRGFADFDWGGAEEGGAVLTGYSRVAVAIRVCSPLMWLQQKKPFGLFLNQIQKNGSGFGFLRVMLLDEVKHDE